VQKAPVWLAVRGIALCSLACTREPEASRTRAHEGASASAPTSSLAEIAPRTPSSRSAADSGASATPLSASEALALVQALPAVRQLAAQTVVIGGKERRQNPVTRVIATPRPGDPEQDFWLMAVGDREIVSPDGGIAEGYQPDYWVRVKPDGRIAIRSAEQPRFRDYASWAERDRRRSELIALVHSTPEWQARAAEVARSKVPFDPGGAVLGLVCGDDFEPANCEIDDSCRLRCDAIRLCNGCAGGLWITLELGAAKRTLQIDDEDVSSPTHLQLLPYGQWRNRFRAAARRERNPEYRTLADPRRSFPDYHHGEGEFGYGTPSNTSTTPAAAVRAALARSGLEFSRIERHGKEGFPVVVAAGKITLPRSRFRSLGAELVHALGDRACELAVSATERYQFDRFVAEKGDGGAYTFIDGGFHPWAAEGG